MRQAHRTCSSSAQAHPTPPASGAPARSSTIIPAPRTTPVKQNQGRLAGLFLAPVRRELGESSPGVEDMATRRRLGPGIHDARRDGFGISSAWICCSVSSILATAFPALQLLV